MDYSQNTLAYNVVQWFEAQAEKTPDYIALVDEFNQYTYQKLNKKVNQLAHALLARQIKQNEFIAVLLEPGAEYICLLLAIIKIGAVYIPLDAQAPQERLNTILKDAQPQLIISDERHHNRIDSLSDKVLHLKKLRMEAISCSKENLAIYVEQEAPFYMIYTSGSTGTPKGVIIPHQAVVNLVAIENYGRVKEQQRVAQYNNLAFDACTFEIWSALLNGASLYIIPEQARTNHLLLKQSLVDFQIHHILVPTGYFHQLIKSAITTLDSVEAIIFGGEAVNPLLLKEFIHHRKQLTIPTQLINGYGPSEATVVACRKLIDLNDTDNEEELASIGAPFTHGEIYILDEQLNPVEEGELYISGLLLALGYHHCPNQNQERFIKNPFCDNAPYQRIYKTGDIVKRLASGNLLFMGRVDDQVKVGGFRVHLNEIEHHLMNYPQINMAAVLVEIGGGHHKILTAYVVFSSKETLTHADALRSYLATKLPAYMLPAKYVMVDTLPLTRIGKIDKKALDSLPHTDLSFHHDTSCDHPIEEHIKKIWSDLLNRTAINTHKNLFDLGANSLLLLEACTRINKELNADITITDLLTYPSIHKLALFMEGLIEEDNLTKKAINNTTEIAIVGMSCRFPKSHSLDEYWTNLCQGVDCLSRTPSLDSMEEHYVPVRGTLKDIDLFDASFFGFNPSDAAVTDPQHRLFLECVWEALEHAGIAPEKINEQIISVFAGMTDSTYLHEYLLKNSWFLKEHDSFAQRIATSMSMLSTQTSYRLNLKGRSVNVNTACSTGLITVDHACQELLNGTSDVAIAGSSTIILPQEQGYTYQEGGILSPDGVCRPFSQQANGTVFSNGVGVVILKRVEDALADNDTIYALIKARSVNNDGGDKLGFAAPSINGQKACIRAALAQAGICAAQIDLVETHGTATALGDVIEFQALSSVYKNDTDKKQFCALGSVKANIGHTDATAGIASLIKTALCLYHKKIPPLIHFQSPNPELKFQESPFYVNTDLIDWNKKEHPRYAGVSAFGIGGTNVHLILSEAPQKPKRTDLIVQDEILLLSAKNEGAFKDTLHALSSHITEHPEHYLTDIAYTLQKGREDFSYRGFIVGSDKKSIINGLPQLSSSFYNEDIHHELVFLFSGQGTQYTGMAMELCDSIPLVKHYMTLGSKLAEPYLHCSLFHLIQDPQSLLLKETRYAQPALFIIEYALAKTLMDLGVQPEVLIGHSLGEYVAACLSEVFTFEDGVALICERGLLMQQAPAGGMILLEASNEELHHYLKEVPVDVALHNSTHQFVLSGASHAIIQLEALLKINNTPYKILPVEHAFHSQLMSSLEESFKELFSNITLSEPKIPIVSNVTGTWLSVAEAMSKEYWYRHMRETVQFCASIKRVLEDRHPLFIEIGPGQGLCQCVKELSQNKAISVSTLPNYQKNVSERHQLLQALGILWTKGVPIKWDNLDVATQKQKLAIPTYSFQKQRYWVEAEPSLHIINPNDQAQKYKPLWSHQKVHQSNITDLLYRIEQHDWIIFEDELGLSQQFISTLKDHNIRPIIIRHASSYKKKNEFSYEINPKNKSDYLQMVRSLKAFLKNPIILHCSSYTSFSSLLPDNKVINSQLDKTLYGLFYLYQTYSELNPTREFKIAFLTHGLKKILGNEVVNPINASLIGASKVLMQENPDCYIKLLDLNMEECHHKKTSLIPNILRSLIDNPWTIERMMTFYRHGYEWNMTFGLIKKSLPVKNHRLRDKGVYLLTGGLGGIGLSFCDAIVSAIQSPTFILIARNIPPSEEYWDILIKEQAPGYEKIIRLAKLKQKGAHFLFFKADITNEAMLKKIFTECLSRVPTIHGVIHAAGVAEPDLANNKSKNNIQTVLGPKLYGTYNLAKMLHSISLDFVMLTSSLSTELGGIYYSDYAAANSALNSFNTEDFFPSASFIININWNTWNDVGLAFQAEKNDQPHFIGLGNDISSTEGKNIFLTALNGSETQILVSNKDIASYLTSFQELTQDSSTSQVKTERENICIKTHFAPSTSKTESQLINLWEEILHINPIGINDNFFDLGGHSLKSIKLLEKINGLFNKKLPASQLYLTPTIKELATTVMNQKDLNKNSILVPLKISNIKTPCIFICHPIIGLANCFDPIIKHYDLPFSLYALQDPSIDHNKMIYNSLNHMAQDYWSAIKKIQPQGPYYLIGYSFGGNVLHEMAHLIHQEQQEIALLAFIDSWALHSPLHQSKTLFQQSIQHNTEYYSNEIKELAWQRENLLRQHEPAKINQKIILFKASELLSAYQMIDKWDNGWSSHNEGSIKHYPINGTHDTIINKENSATIIKLIKKEIATSGTTNESIK